MSFGRQFAPKQFPRPVGTALLVFPTIRELGAEGSHRLDTVWLSRQDRSLQPETSGRGTDGPYPVMGWQACSGIHPAQRCAGNRGANPLDSCGIC